MYNILICDDDRDIVAALKIYLSADDYRIFSAYTGLEALEIARREKIQLILMDVMMPELDGISATAKLRAESNVPIILLTAKSETSDKILGLNIARSLTVLQGGTFELTVDGDFFKAQVTIPACDNP